MVNEVFYNYLIIWNYITNITEVLRSEVFSSEICGLRCKNTANG